MSRKLGGKERGSKKTAERPTNSAETARLLFVRPEGGNFEGKIIYGETKF